MLTTIVACIVVLVILILAHELGHFVTAKLSKVRVEEFGIGFPPRLASVRWGETRYSLNAIPLGGFVRMAGEEDPGTPGSLASKSIPTRLLVLSAGSMMNLLLPFLLFPIAFMVPHQTVMGQVVVEAVAPNSPAAAAGIEAGDIFLEINGKAVRSAGDITRQIYINLGKRFTAKIEHSDSTTEEVSLTARWKPPEGQGAVGVAVRTVNPTPVTQHHPFWQAIPLGVVRTWETFILFKNGIISMFIGALPVELAGPVGIAQLTGEVARAGIRPLLEFAAFLSINLGILNILPIPAFDGGRVVFVLLELARRGKRVAPSTERLIHTIGFVLLIAALIAITYNDIMRFIAGRSLAP